MELYFISVPPSRRRGKGVRFSRDSGVLACPAMAIGSRFRRGTRVVGVRLLLKLYIFDAVGTSG